MTTKLLLLLAALLIAKYTQSVAVTENQTSFFAAFQSASAAADPVQPQPYGSVASHPGSEADRIPHYENTYKPNQDEEGDHHHLHFEYLAGPDGRRWLAALVAKALITVTFIGSLFACFHHVTHMHIHLF